MKLNKRDSYIYKNFLLQMKKGFNNIYLDEYAPIIQKFIEKYYVSDNALIDDLDDFIQYALIIIIKYAKYDNNFYSKSGYLILRFKKIYQRIKEEKKEEKLAITPTCIIDEDEIFFRIFINQIKDNLSENKKVILEDYINGIKQKDTARRINTSHQNVNQERIKIIDNITKSSEFKLYYNQDEISPQNEKTKKKR